MVAALKELAPLPEEEEAHPALVGLCKTAEATLIWISEKSKRESIGIEDAVKKAPAVAAMLQDMGLEKESSVISSLVEGGEPDRDLWELHAMVQGVVDRLEALMEDPKRPVLPHEIKKAPPNITKMEQLLPSLSRGAMGSSEREERRRRRAGGAPMIPRQGPKNMGGLSDCFLRTANFMVRSRKALNNRIDSDERMCSGPLTLTPRVERKDVDEYVTTYTPRSLGDTALVPVSTPRSGAAGLDDSSGLLGKRNSPSKSFKPTQFVPETPRTSFGPRIAGVIKQVNEDKGTAHLPFSQRISPN